MLYGMADAEKQAIVDAGYRMRIYMPYGELIPGMAYLVRRLLENTSNESFLRAELFRSTSPLEKLLMNPWKHPRGDCVSEEAGEQGAGSGGHDVPASLKPQASSHSSLFRNEPTADFAARRASAADSQT